VPSALICEKTSLKLGGLFSRPSPAALGVAGSRKSKRRKAAYRGVELAQQRRLKKIEACGESTRGVTLMAAGVNEDRVSKIISQACRRHLSAPLALAKPVSLGVAHRLIAVRNHISASGGMAA